MTENKKIPQGAEKVKKFLTQYLPDGAINYLRETLKSGKQAHLYGEQGGGKSTIRNLFQKHGYNVTAPEDVDKAELPYSLPEDIHNVALIEVAYQPYQAKVYAQDVSKADIEEWLNA